MVTVHWEIRAFREGAYRRMAYGWASSQISAMGRSLWARAQPGVVEARAGSVAAAAPFTDAISPLQYPTLRVNRANPAEFIGIVAGGGRARRGPLEGHPLIRFSMAFPSALPRSFCLHRRNAIASPAAFSIPLAFPPTRKGVRQRGVPSGRPPNPWSRLPMPLLHCHVIPDSMRPTSNNW